MEDMATVEFYRPPKWSDLLRAYKILIDGHQVGTVRRGRRLSIDVSPGRHVAQARIDWTGSEELEFDVAAGSLMVLWVEPAGDAFHGLERASTRTGYLRLLIK